MRRHFLLLIVGLVGAGCASTTENLQRETARNIGDVHPDKVSVSNVKRGVTSVSWEAETPKGRIAAARTTWFDASIA